MRPGQMALDLGEGSYCEGCIAREFCGDAATARACQPLYGEPRYGGVNVVHPSRHDFAAYFAEIGGPGFEDIHAAPVKFPALPLTTPRVYPRRALAGHLHRDFYAVGPDEAIFGRRRVLAADELREILGLWANQGLALMVYGQDEQLEKIWGRRRSIVTQISEANYDFVSPPSFSALINHPPSEALRNLKRSLCFFQLLQEHDITTAPRLAWLSEYDVRRVAEWCNSQENVHSVTLDLAIKHLEEWFRQLALLRQFDELTDRRLTFFIHGPAAQSRLVDLFRILGGRVRLTGTRAISKPRESTTDFVTFADEEEAIALHSLKLAAIEPEHRGVTRPARMQRVELRPSRSSREMLAA